MYRDMVDFILFSELISSIMIITPILSFFCPIRGVVETLTESLSPWMTRVASRNSSCSSTDSNLLVSQEFSDPSNSIKDLFRTSVKLESFSTFSPAGLQVLTILFSSIVITASCMLERMLSE